MTIEVRGAAAPHWFPTVPADFIGAGTHPARLAALDRFAQADAWSELGKQHARAGNTEMALAARTRADDELYTDPADEISLAIMEHHLTEGEDTLARLTFNDISPNMRPWGVIKLLKHGRPVRRWHREAYAVEDSWHQYNTRQQGEIIDDLLAMGDTGRALLLARQIALPGYSEPAEREAQRTALLKVAHAQARAGNPQAGIDTLAEIQAEAENGLNAVIAYGMVLPSQPATPEEQEAAAEHAARLAEYQQAYNLAAQHTIALRAYQSPRLARQQLERMMAYGDDHRQLLRRAAGRLLGKILGSLGRPPKR